MDYFYKPMARKAKVQIEAELPLEKVFAILEDDDEFPVDFDKAWKWIEYPRKDKALEKLRECLEEGIDFLPKKGEKSQPKKGRPLNKIYLTVDGFKYFCMAANTEKGKQVRAYFLRCERELKRRLVEEKARHSHLVIRACVDERAAPWEQRFFEHFWDELYRVTGWKRPEKGNPPSVASFIAHYIYPNLPAGVHEELKRVNPTVNKRRSRAQHQHLKTDGLRALEQLQKTFITILHLTPSNNFKQLKANLKREFSTAIQLELNLFDDFNEESVMQLWET